MDVESLPRALADTAQRVEYDLVGWRVARLRDVLVGPLAIMGVGGSRVAAELWARLHERTGHPAWALGPHDLIQIGRAHV